MLNVGPDSKGRVSEMAAAALRKSGKWVHAHPEAVYGAGPSPWGHALPWGDAVVQGDKIELVVFDWPASGKLWVPGLKTPVKSAKLDGKKKLAFSSDDGWLCIKLPGNMPEEYAAVIELSLNGEIEVDGTICADPDCVSAFPAETASFRDCSLHKSSWMEKFGEWKFKNVAQGFNENSAVTWQVDFKAPGIYNVELEYAGTDPVEWKVLLDGSEALIDWHKITNAYAWYPLGWVRVETPGTHTFTLVPSSGDFPNAKVASMRLTPVAL